MNQPVLGSQFLMNMAGQNTMSNPNPLAYNYPKIPHYTGSQYSTYPKFKQARGEENPEKHAKNTSKDNGDFNLDELNSGKHNKKTEELADKLREEIKKLEELTSKAQNLVGKRDLEDSSSKGHSLSGHLRKSDKNNKEKSEVRKLYLYYI